MPFVVNCAASSDKDCAKYSHLDYKIVKYYIYIIETHFLIIIT